MLILGYIIFIYIFLKKDYRNILLILINLSNLILFYTIYKNFLINDFLLVPYYYCIYLIYFFLIIQLKNDLLIFLNNLYE